MEVYFSHSAQFVHYSNEELFKSVNCDYWWYVQDKNFKNSIRMCRIVNVICRIDSIWNVVSGESTRQ